MYIKTNGTGALFYILKDHLGSIQYICSETGLKLEEMSFDAWGRSRNPADYSDFNVAPSNYLNRGFTGHEHLTAFGLIDMNGRVYDPILGRFLSPDPYVQMPGFTQSFNRYSYCLNNPLIFTDPSGEAAWMLWPISWGGNWLFGGLDRWLNGKQSFKQAFSFKNNPIVIGGNFSPSNMTLQNNYGFSNYQVDAQKAANLPYQIGTDAFNEVRSEKNMNEWRDASNGIIVPNIIGGMENTSQAFYHYFNGNGTSVMLGNETVDALLSNKDFQFRHQRIITGETTSLSGSFSVDMTSTVFHVGRTNVDYSISNKINISTVTYDLFVRDGFWDIDFIDERILGRMGESHFLPDGVGPNLERFGGVPYPYTPIKAIYTFPNPGY